MPRRPGWIAVLGEVEGLRWVLEKRRMAFTRATRTRAGRIEPGDRIVLYTSRGAFHNPTRDESRFTAIGEVSGAVHDFRRPIEIAGMDFVCGCDIRLEVILPERAGVPVKPLVGDLSFVRRPEVWGQYFRSGLIEVPAGDLDVVARAVRATARARGVR